LDNNFYIADARYVFVERLSATAANQGDVTDFSFISDNEEVN